MNISGLTKIAGIFGFPVRHTLSPAMHNAALQALKLDFAYLPFEVDPASLGAAVEGIRAMNLRGVNVTIPHKETVMKFLDAIDPLAKKIGSVNTIVNNNGKLTGYNTDGIGFLRDIENNGFNPKGKTAVLLGAGGAGRAVAAVLSWAKLKKLYITDMDEAKAKALARRITNAEFVKFSGWKYKANSVDLLINATPAGMHKGPAPIKSGELKKNIFVYDLVYNRRTELLAEAKKAGAKCCSGLGMLINQGAAAFELWTGKKAPILIMRKALLKQLRKK